MVSTPLLTLVLASFLARFSHQMARSPVLPRFAQDLGAAPELIGLIVAASTVTGVFIKLPAGALSDVLGRKRMMLLGCLFFAGTPFLSYTASYSAATYLAVGTLGLLPLLMILRLPDDGPRLSSRSTLGARSSEFWSGIWEVLSSRAVLMASALEGALFFGYGAFLGFFPTYARTLGLNDAQIALVMGVQLASTMLAKPLSGRASDRLGRKPMIVVGL
jgi:MFS family permease